jgi:hypothetical protein
MDDGAGDTLWALSCARTGCALYLSVNLTTGTQVPDTKVSNLRVCLFLGAIACVLGASSTPAARAAPNCAEFFYNSDGSWSPTHPIVIAGPTSQTQVMPSDKFRPDMPGLGGRIAASLNANCREAKAFVGARNIPKIP